MKTKMAAIASKSTTATAYATQIKLVCMRAMLMLFTVRKSEVNVCRETGACDGGEQTAMTTNRRPKLLLAPI
jgi:hypothetical protein